VVALFISVPFYFLWNWLGPTYFYWLPPVYLEVPFWHCTGLFMMMPMLKMLVFPLQMGSSSSTAKVEDSKRKR
jgi:hypothetical protein